MAENGLGETVVLSGGFAAEFAERQLVRVVGALEDETELRKRDVGGEGGGGCVVDVVIFLR